MKKVVMANDQGAVELALKIKKHLEEKGYEVNYLGIDKVVSIDYPDQAEKACKEFNKGGYEFGIVCCGTGIGISIAANKIKGIRCALVQDCMTATLAKEHNDANFLAFGGRVTYKEDVLDILDAYLDAQFLEGRHQRRVNKIMNLETK
ncbi:MAG: RpiB/LacA/LacB family sugar-phosphate isomerase [Sphaerochaetaceae bacterium]